MNKFMNKWSQTVIIIFALITFYSSQTIAQDEITPQQPTDTLNQEDGPTEPDNNDSTFLAGEKTEEEQMMAAPVVDKTISLKEDPETSYLSVGPRLRWIFIPKWFVGMFGVDIKEQTESSPMISNVGIGAEFIYRKDNFDITAALWWAGLSWDDGKSFKGKSEDGNSWEVVTNDMSSLLITADFVWSAPITDWFAITYGAGLGLGIPFGEITRTEATFASDGFNPCESADWGNDQWCQNDETERGSKYDLPTKIVPWINFLGGVRFKPHRHLAIYVDGGFGLGFQMGTRAAYIF